MLSNQSLLFFGCAVQKNIQQIFDMAFSLQSFHEQRMPFVLRLLGCVLLLPCPEMMEVIRQHFVASVFLLLVSLFRGRLSDMGLGSVLLPVVIADTEIVSQLHSGSFAGQSEQTGNKINGISVRLASKAMKTLIDFHAWVLIIVKWADCHAVAVDFDAVHLSRLSGGQVLFDRFKYIHCIFLSGNKKALDIFTMKTASALQFHILFFLLRGFLLLLIAALLLQKLHLLRDGVLRFGLLLDLGLLRREDFADPIANILHRL